MPKPGFFNNLLRVGGLFLAVGGLLLAAASAVGFLILLIKTAPDLISAASNLQQQMAGFLLILLLTWLAVPLVLGLGGMVMAFVGVVCHLAGTRKEGG